MPSAASPPPEKPSETAGLKRFFVDRLDAVATFPVEITVTDSAVCHHLRTVMRIRPGETVVLVDAQQETAYAGILQALEKHRLTVTLTEQLPAVADPLSHVTLAVAVIKEQRWDWLLQKATELGVRTIQPLLAERSVIRLKSDEAAKKQERWRAILRAAAEQSEGLFIPRMLRPITVAQYCQSERAEGLKLLLQERGEDRQPLKTRLHGLPNSQGVTMAIGPEGGWSSAELETFKTVGFEPVSLGQRILRSETAAIAAMSALVYECADEGGG